MTTAHKPTLDAVLRLRRERKRLAQQMQALRECPYKGAHIFAGVTTADPVDNGESYVSQSFARLVKSPNWSKGSKARETFAGMLLSGADIAQARLQTLTVHGI